MSSKAEAMLPGVARSPNTLPAPRAGADPGRVVSQRAQLDWLMMALIGAVLTYVWRIQDLYPILGAIKLPILASALAYGFYLIDGNPRRSLREIGANRVVKITGFIVLLAILSVPTSLHDGASFFFIKDDLGKNFILMILIAASVRCFADVRRFAMTVVIGGLMYAYYIETSVTIGLGGRLGDIVYYDSNDIGLWLVCTIPLSIYFLARGKNLLTRLVAVASLAVFIDVIIKSGSRGAFLGLMAVSLYFLFFFSSLGRGVRMAAFALGFVTVMTVGSDQYWTMMRTLLHPKDDYNWSGKSDGGRAEVWKRGMGYMFSRPLLGVGVNAFAVAEGTISPLAKRQEMGIGLKWSAAHNSFVQIGAELGVFGLLALVVLLIQAFRTARARPPPGVGRKSVSDEEMMGQALAGSIIGYVVAGFFLSQAYAAYMLTIYGIIVGLAKIRTAQSSHGGPGQAAAVPALRSRRLALRPHADNSATW